MRLTKTETQTEELANGNNLLIAFDGLGLLHRGESNWRCWFPSIEDHDLTLEIEKAGMKPTKFLIPAGSTVEIECDVENQRVEDGTFSTEILNVNADDLHHDGLKVRDDHNDNISRLKFSRDINLFPWGNSNAFDIWRCNAAGDRKDKTSQVTSRESVTSAIQCRLNTTTKIKIRGQINTDFDLLQDRNSTYYITFNNRCESLGCATSSDYHFYYTLIDLPSNEDKFELTPVPHIDPTRGPAPMCDIVYGDDLDYTGW